MTVYGLTEDGFERKRLLDILEELETSLKTAFGENIDLTSESGFGQFVGIMSEAFSDQWQSQEDTYNSQYPSTAQSTQLSNVVMLNGIERKEATYSTVTATITGTSGTVIPAGNQASVADTQAVFITQSEVTITAGTIDVEMVAEEAGEISALSGTLTTIETPIFGWTGVTNALDADEGTAQETDPELRIRREDSVSAGASNIADSLYSQLINLDDVEDVYIIDNKTSGTVGGIPAHQFLTTIIGGEDESIAEIIWANTAEGIQSFGSTTEEITDSQGFPQDVKFSRPDDVDIYFKVTITTDSDFPVGGSTDIKEAIVDYGDANFKISDDVIFSKFYTPINTVAGITSITLLMDVTTPVAGSSNISIDVDEVSAFDTSRVEVIIS